jgi:SAM-dependent methyltransferase
MSNFKSYSKYYDLLYKDKDYKAESDYVFNALNEYDTNIESILELGCGSGCHANFLSKKGLEITGIERSESMVQEAITKNIPNFNPLIADITNFKIDKQFDAVISLFHVISYLTDNESLINCFKLTNQHLKHNGLFLFDIWYSPAVYVQKPGTRIKRLENNDIKITRIAESQINYNRNIVDVNFEVNILNKYNNRLEIINENHPMRHFSLLELDLLAQLTGFELIKAEEFLTHNIPNENTWGVSVIFKKK